MLDQPHSVYVLCKNIYSPHCEKTEMGVRLWATRSAVLALNPQVMAYGIECRECGRWVGGFAVPRMLGAFKEAAGRWTSSRRAKAGDRSDQKASWREVPHHRRRGEPERSQAVVEVSTK